MSTIDNRVVEMNFDGSKFSGGVTQTMSMLDKLKAALHLDGASKGLQDVNNAASSFNSGPMEQGAGRISASFSSMQAIAFGALANIGAKVASVAANMASSFTIAPITAGFSEYETKIGSIQTILANTQKYGTTLPTVNKALDELNAYADKTIYSFGDMTKNVGLFTNAGIKVEDATAMIRGFSNAAAASGTSAEGASNAAFQLSQALSTGTIRAQDWISLTNVGMGNDNMKTGLIDIAKAMGTFSGSGTDATKAGKDFKGSLEKGWLSADVMSNYLNIMSGDMDEAKMKTLGLTDAQIANFKATQATAEDAATKIRTFSSLMGTLHEAVGSGWSQTFQILLGDFDEATTLFTNLGNAATGFANRMATSRNDLLQGWKDLGGRTQLIEGLTAAFWDIGMPLGALGTAFRQVFPKSTAQNLYDMTVAFNNFMAELTPSSDTMDRLVRTFAGLFAILHIGWTVIKALAGFFVDLFAGVEEGDKGILRTTATIGDFFVGLDKAISAGHGITDFFDTLLRYLFKIINPIKDAGEWFGKLVSGMDLSGAGGAIGEFIDTLLGIGEAAQSTADSGNSILDTLGRLGKGILNFARAVADFVSPVTDAITGAIQNLDFDKVMEFFQTLSLGGIAGGIFKLGGVFKNLFKNFELFRGAGGGIMDKIRDGLDGLSGTLKAMQANLKASMLLKIAGAIALLAVSVVLLASVDAGGLARATAALTVMFVQLGAAMQAFQKIGSIASIAKLNLMGAALILLGVAILILVGAVKILSNMSWEELGKGMAGLAVLIAGLILMSKGMDRSRGAILRSAAAMIIMGAALEILVFVVKQFGAMDLVTLGKGIASVAVLLLALGLFSRLQKASAGAVAQGVSILLLAYAMKMLADAVKVFATMSWEELGKGFAAIAVGLLLIGGALRLMPQGAKTILIAMSIAKVAGAMGLIALAVKAYENISWETMAKGLLGTSIALGVMAGAMRLMPKVGLPQALGLLMVATAIGTLSLAVKTMGAMDLESLGRGLGGLAAMLLVLTIALKFMEGSLTGAAALLIVAVALNVLIPVISTLGNMPIPVIVTALIALAAVFAILGVAAWALAPVVPVLLALGIAIGLLGLALALAGAGVFLFATGLSLLAVAGAGATASIVAMVAGLIGLIPMVIEQIGLGIVAFARVIADSGQAILEAISTILIAFLQAIIDVTPKVVETLLTLLFAFLSTLEQAVPRIIETGIHLLLALLDGIGRNIGQIVDKAVTIVVNFVNAIARNLPRIIQAGIDLILALMNGIGDAARNNGPKLADASWNMVTGIIDGIVSGLSRLGSKFKDALVNLAKSAFKGVLSFFGIGSPSKKFKWVSEMNVAGLVQGIDQYGYRAVDATEGMGADILDTMGKTISGLGDLVNADVDMNPVITPVLDLTDVRNQATTIGSILDTQPLDVGSSYSGAASASAEYLRNQAALDELAAGQDQAGVMFVQNNYSPKTISAAETYRNTKSQLSVAKEALKTNVG